MTELLIESGISPLVANILRGFIFLPFFLVLLLVSVVVFKAARRLPSRVRYLISIRKDGISSWPSSQLYNEEMTLFLRDMGLVVVWPSLVSLIITLYIIKGAANV